MTKLLLCTEDKKKKVEKKLSKTKIDQLNSKLSKNKLKL